MKEIKRVPVFLKHSVYDFSIHRMLSIDLWWANISRVISDVSGPKFASFLPNVVRIIVNKAVFHLPISPFVLEIFVIKV